MQILRIAYHPSNRIEWSPEESNGNRWVVSGGLLTPTSDPQTPTGQPAFPRTLNRHVYLKSKAYGEDDWACEMENVGHGERA